MTKDEIATFKALAMAANDRQTNVLLWHERRYHQNFARIIAESIGMSDFPRREFTLIRQIREQFEKLRQGLIDPQEPTFECVGCGGTTEAEGLRWKKLGEGKSLTVSHDRSKLPRALSKLTDKKIYEKSFKPWETDVVKFKPITKGKGDIHIQWKHVDGVGGTLEFVWQPSGSAEFMEQAGDLSGDMTMDYSERWTETSATEVIKHGAGHAIGIGHNPLRQDVMYPYADSRVKQLSKNDLRERDERYPV